MSGRIGWYVHHHGRGHLTRMRAIAAHLPHEIACFSSLARPAELPARVTWTQLPPDDQPRPQLPEDDPTARGLLHWAPLGHGGHRTRLAAVAAAVAAAPVDAFVVDVSAEVTLLARLLGLRTVVIAQPGDRSDEPHRLAYAAAERIVAPWPDWIDLPAHLVPHADRVDAVGGISRFDGREAGAERDNDVVLLGGGGGSGVAATDIAAAERATGRTWRVLGAGSAAWLDDPWGALTTAGTVVSWCGQNAIADIAAAGAPAVVVPQDRPFDEQRATARILDSARLAVASERWPAASAWPALVERARLLEPRWERWRVAGAAQRASEAISRVAGAVGVAA